MLRNSSSVLPACEAAAPSARGCPKHMDVPPSNVLPWTPGACKSLQWHSCISLKDFSWNKKSKPFHLRLPDSIGRQNPEKPGSTEYHWQL